MDKLQIKNEIGENIKILLSLDIPAEIAFNAFVSPKNLKNEAMDLSEAEVRILNNELYAIRKIIAFTRKEAENGYFQKMDCEPWWSIRKIYVAAPYKEKNAPP